MIHVQFIFRDRILHESKYDRTLAEQWVPGVQVRFPEHGAASGYMPYRVIRQDYITAAPEDFYQVFLRYDRAVDRVRLLFDPLHKQ